MANDVNRFDLVTIFLHYMWSAPLSAIIVAYILYSEVGYSGLIGIAAIFLVVPIQCESLVVTIECGVFFLLLPTIERLRN